MPPTGSRSFVNEGDFDGKGDFDGISDGLNAVMLIKFKKRGISE